MVGSSRIENEGFERAGGGSSSTRGGIPPGGCTEKSKKGRGRLLPAASVRAGEEKSVLGKRREHKVQIRCGPGFCVWMGTRGCLLEVPQRKKPIHTIQPGDQERLGDAGRTGHHGMAEQRAGMALVKESLQWRCSGNTKVWFNARNGNWHRRRAQEPD